MAATEKERRHWPRYRVKTDTLLFNDSIFAEIVNISKGGVLCSYLLAHGEKPLPVRLINLIDMKTRSSLLAIPCADLNYREADTKTPLAKFRKSRLEFLPTGEQFRHDLHSFIDSIIAEPA